MKRRIQFKFQNDKLNNPNFIFFVDDAVDELLGKCALTLRAVNSVYGVHSNPLKKLGHTSKDPRIMTVPTTEAPGRHTNLCESAILIRDKRSS
jgi:hypothetical protein